MNERKIHRRSSLTSLVTLLVACMGLIASSLAVTASPAAAVAPPPPADFDGDGDTDLAVFRPGSGVWFVNGGDTTSFGVSGDAAVPGDYDGDGDTDIAVYRPGGGYWFVAGGATTQFGAPGDVPVPADYDGDGDTDIAVYRPASGYWFVHGGPITQFGTAGDVPVPGDYDGDGDTDIAVYRPASGYWFVHGGPSAAWGTAGDFPVPGDYDGDGDTDIAVFRQSVGVWFVNGGAVTQFGTAGDLPQPGNYDGDPATDIAVFRPSIGLWFVESAGAVPWGTAGDVPVVLPAAIHQYAAATALGAGPRLLSAAPEGDARVKLTFDRALAPSAADPVHYSSSPDLMAQSATLVNGSIEVLLGTGPHYQVSYTVTAGAGVTDESGNPVDPGSNRASFTGTQPINGERPRVTTATSTGNTKVVVQFSNPMADNALDPSRYSVVQENVNAEVGTVGVTHATFVRPDRLSVELTTLSQNEVTYRVKVGDVTDLRGKPLADRTTIGGVLVDPTSTTFAGTPPTTTERVDTDGDGLFDNEETLGWTVIVELATGAVSTRQVTSSPLARDTDRDGLEDYQEKSLTTDPRDDDTDDDQLSDATEFNDIYSDPTQQDSDDDGLTDGLEVTFFLTSAILPDTDGDQLADGSELNLARRNPKVADLPKPSLEIGEMNLGLDVRFLESTATETKTVEEKTATSRLSQTDRKEFSSTESRTIEVGTRMSQTESIETSAALKFADAGVVGGKLETKMAMSVTTEQSFSAAFTSSFTETSSQETESAYENSLTTEREIADSSTLTREVRGARAQVGVMLKSGGDIAFNIRNLQVSALIQDPQDPSRLTPIATLLPDSEPAGGFNLGPLVPARGPILFSNEQVFPNLIEDLMRNPRGVVFRFANYDIVDELGRNFAFTSQDINDRTARVAIDYGGFDGDNDGLGDDSEIARVATGMGRGEDTDGDGVVDRRIVFNEHGQQEGTTLREALQAMGLHEYNENHNPTSELTQAQIDNSYSVIKVFNDERQPREILWRVRRTVVEEGVPNEWFVLTPTGIDRTLTLDDVVLRPGGSVTLAFVQDKDEDNMPALIESLNRCADSSRDANGDGLADTLDTDGDHLDDRFEVLIGWRVTTERGTRGVRSRCFTNDSDDDGLTDDFEAPGVTERGDDGLILFDTNHAPRRDRSNGTPDDDSDDLTDQLLVTLRRAPGSENAATGASDPVTGKTGDPITNPASPDTDFDGLDDKRELTPYRVDLYGGGQSPLVITSAERLDSDDDTAADGIEFRVGGNPREFDSDNFGDLDGDGLVNAQEAVKGHEQDDPGYQIEVLPTRARFKDVDTICDSVCFELNLEDDPVRPETRTVHSDRRNADTDGDGLSDLEEFDLKLDPGVADLNGDGKPDGPDTDRDGLSDFAEVRGYEVPDFGVMTTDPADADSDNDKLSDGEEALNLPILVPADNPLHLPTFQRRVVRVPGQAPYQAFSDPREPDGDADRLVDGDEATFGSDPANWNTDSDPRGDYSEVITGRRPLVPDLAVRATFGFIEVINDGESGDGAGDFTFALGVRRPSAPDQTVVAFTSNYVLGPGGVDVSDVPGLHPCGNGDDSICRKSNARNIIQIDASDRDDGMLRSRTPRSVEAGPISTTDALYEQLVIAGVIDESDEEGPQPDCRALFPDPLHPPEDTGIVPGRELKPGIFTLSLKRKVHCLHHDDTLELILHVSYTAG